MTKQSDFIKAIHDESITQAESIFNAMLSNKVQNHIDGEKLKVTAKIFNNEYGS